MERYDAVGLSAVVVKDNKIIYQESFGINPTNAAPEEKKLIKNDDLYWIGSISKSFVGVAIMQLVEKRIIRLDDDVNEYLRFRVRSPFFPEVPITIGMLLCHRSGLNDSQYGWSLNMFTTKDTERYKRNFNNYKPGTAYFYTNLGYSLLAAVIESATGSRFDKYVEKEILSPLKIGGSYNLLNIDSTRFVHAYRFNEKKKKFEESPMLYDYDYLKENLVEYKLGYSTPIFSPAGGMKMTAGDLAVYMRMFMNYGRIGWKRLLRKKTVIDMWSPQASDNNYGLGLTSYTNIVLNKTFIGMRGGSHGFHSIMVFDPEKRYGFVVLNNGYNTTAVNRSDMNFAVVRALYRYFIQEGNEN